MRVDKLPGASVRQMSDEVTAVAADDKGSDAVVDRWTADEQANDSASNDFKGLSWHSNASSVPIGLTWLSHTSTGSLPIVE
eukprot:CAMPEP_0183481012 /NCGR_PEP_ID=MMETSP0370-20130417/174220_1 /TAXON_ID=268820 /ORGANISM="Peridinium aciculiferum, Strain PAER-2" /LENGTH=80 /DNA_ID=CAMNT_0025674115 /DNA_START=56 /DNA_END=295 /DNA_ORIENTATION=+